jgi:membrane fusion protein, multidrug efflux system
MKQMMMKSTLYATVVAIAAAAWILTGTVSTSTSTSAPANVGAEASRVAPAAEEPSHEGARLRVSVLESRAREVTRQVRVSAQTAPNRTVEIRAETEGRVVAIGAERGAWVATGKEIVRLDERDRSARLAEAEALIAQYTLQYEAAERLSGQSLVSEAQIAETKARLIAARAELADIEVEIANTRIRAPFDARVQDRLVEIGDFVRVGDSIAVLVDTDPLIVSGSVTENEIGALTIGQTGQAELADGRTVEGQVRYVAPVASEGTRTFLVELAVPNEKGALRAGISAKLSLAAEESRGHLLPPSVMTLDDAGAIGVKIVEDNNSARFVPVQILSASGEGVWVSGLPELARVISVGQGFVTDGQLVEPVTEPTVNSGLQ